MNILSSLEDQLSKELHSMIERGVLPLLGEGKQVAVYKIPGKDLVVKIPTDSMDPGQLVARKIGLEIVSRHLPPSKYYKTIILEDIGGYHFVEVQEESKEIFIDALKRKTKLHGLKGFRECLNSLYSFENALKSNAVYMLDWAGELRNIGYNSGGLRLFDFGALTESSSLAKDSLMNQRFSKIDNTVESLRAEGFEDEFLSEYINSATIQYDPELFFGDV